MTTEENKTFIRRYFEALGKEKSAQTVAAFVTDESLKQHIVFFEAAFPGYQLSVDDLVAEGDKVAVRSTFTGTHRGELMGVAPTGKPVSIGLLLIYRIAGGKIVEHWMQADTLGILQQIGAMPAPAH
jgi:predicted ester cyclase